MTSPSATSVTRRRQRSTRLTVAVTLLVVAALAVMGAAATGSWLLVTLAAVLAVVLGAAATKITHAELLASRRDAARDRAEQAQAYRRMTEERAAENKAFADHMKGELERREKTVGELEAALAAAHQRAAAAIRARGDEARRAAQAERNGDVVRAKLEEAEARAAEAILRVAELEQELDVVRAELEAERSAGYRTRSA
ncbi:hypothetical protein AB3X52_01515 [Nocardioides sp. DS6]|uniref:Multidomain membrane protein n=1 Tax=Nocardioides eburneus TaxID=3231482 RepID=A0ABV3STL7_9ACTN